MTSHHKLFFIFGVLLIITSMMNHAIVSGTSEGLLIITNNLDYEADTDIRMSTSVLNNSGELGNIYVIVNSSIYSNISNALNQYEADAEITGYNVTMINATSSLVPNVASLRSLIQTAYTSQGIEGAVLVGNLPYAEYFLSALSNINGTYPDEIFPCDLYLMDLNGTWSWDPDPSKQPPLGMPQYPAFDFNNHTGHVKPEIWVGRIDPNCLTGENQTKLLIEYFQKNHNYKIGDLNRTHSALLYIDDDWASVSSEWNTDMQRAYGNTTIINTSFVTDDDDFEQILLHDYEWIWLFAHSNSTHHGFKPNWYLNTTSSSELKSIDTQALFYNLYACHSTNFTTPDNIGTQYLFNNNTIMVVGPTKTGALSWGEDFYTGLNNNKTIGDSFVIWLSNSPRGVADRYASYGTIILGDPLLTINHDVTIYPPTVTSSTHPSQTTVYDETTAILSWTYPPDVTGIAGSYVSLDQSALSSPLTNGDWVTNNSMVYSNLDKSVLYFHLVTQDGAGCLSSVISYKINLNIPDSSSSSTNGTSGSTSGFELFSVSASLIAIYIAVNRRRKNP